MNTDFVLVPPRGVISWDEYSAWIKSTSWYYGVDLRGRDEYNYVFGAMASEGGECFDALKKCTRRRDFGLWMERSGRSKMLLEMGDVMWYLTRGCQLLGVTLEEVMLLNMIKLTDRYRTMAPDAMDYHEPIPESAKLWPLTHLPLDAASKWMQLIESRTMEASASTFTVIATFSKPSLPVRW